MAVTWTGATNILIGWGRRGEMQQFSFPVRVNTPQVFEYSFTDSSGTPIDLTGYEVVVLELKCQGFVFSMTAAEVVDPSAGKVRKVDQAFTQVGLWIAQFYFVNSSGRRVYGDPVQFKVVKNIDDLDLQELPSY